MKKIPLLLTALTAAVILASCGDSAAKTSADETKTDDVATVTETEETEETRPAVGLPSDLDFGGATFNMLSFEWQGYQYYFFADEQTGDVMNDAIFARKQTVEDTLNVKLTYEMGPGKDNCSYVTEHVKTTVMAGDDEYQMALFHCIDGIQASASSGYLYNLDEMPYIDTDAEWWNKEQMEVLRLGQNTYYAVNDFMLPCPYVIVFNKQIITDNDMADPYQLVYDGKWTLDTFASMAREVTKDLDGDGKMTMEADMYGITSNETSKYISFMPASNQFITEKGSDGKVALAMNTEKTQKIIETFADLATDNVCYVPASQSSDDQLWMHTGRVLFDMNALTHLEELRDCEYDYGILPYPKYDEAQENYRSMDWGGLMGIPTTIQNPEMVGAVMELLAYESGSTDGVIDTYYGEVLQGKLSRDEDAEKMLDLIFDTICYEVGGNYFGFESGFNELFYCISNLAITQKSTDFASFYSKKETSAQKVIDKFYDRLEETENS